MTMEGFNVNRWMDSYIDSQSGMTDREKQQAKNFKTPSDFVGIITRLERNGQGHLRTIYVRLRAMSKVIRVPCASEDEANTAAAFYEYLLYKSEIEDKVARASRVETKAKRVGWIKTLTDLVKRKAESKGFRYLVDANRLDVSLEYFVLMNQRIFDEEAVAASHAKLSKHGKYYR
jgi:hypothetical protein